MAEETTSGNPYDIVLSDLKAKRAQLDNAIAAIEAIISGNPVMSREGDVRRAHVEIPQLSRQVG